MEETKASTKTRFFLSRRARSCSTPNGCPNGFSKEEFLTCWSKTGRTSKKVSSYVFENLEHDLESVMRDTNAYTVDVNAEPNARSSNKTYSEPGGPLTKSTPTPVGVPILDKFLNDILDGKDVAVESSSEEEPQMKRIEP